MKGFIGGLLFLTAASSFAESKYKALPVPTNVRVTSSAPRQVVWATLTPKEQNLAKHLLAAARAGNVLVYFQSHRHSLLMQAWMSRALASENLANTKAILGDAYTEFLNYAAKFRDQGGPYANSNRKYLLVKTTPAHIEALFQAYAPKAKKKSVKEIVALLTDADYEPIAKPEDSEGTDLEISGNNMYERGITAAEATEAFKNGLDSRLNCRIERDADGKLFCNVQALNNPDLDPHVRRALNGVVKHLAKALPFATSEHQANEIKYLIKYLKYGDIQDFRQMNIEWVKDGTSSTVDFMMGFVEVYEDFHNQIGSWESYVQIVDPKMTDLSKNLAKNAQTFENNMPYGDFKKTFPENYSPPAMMVYYFQEISNFRSGGYNLPNFDDIRRDVGAKNIIRLDLPGLSTDPTMLKVRREMYEEFAPPAKVDGIVNDWTKARQAIVLLHEIIGHGSGTYDTTKYKEQEDPIGALGTLGSALEEQRADLAALVFAADPILVNVGFYTDLAEAVRVRNVMYDTYLANFLQKVSKQRSLSEAHQRGNWLLIKQLIDKGAVEKVSKDGSAVTDENYVLAVKDYEAYYKVSKALLEELQRIKAVRDEAGLKALFTNDAPLGEIEKPWMQAAIVRGAKLSVNAGSIEQPWELKHNEIHPLGEVSLEGIAPFIGK